MGEVGSGGVEGAGTSLQGQHGRGLGRKETCWDQEQLSLASRTWTDALSLVGPLPVYGVTSPVWSVAIRGENVSSLGANTWAQPHPGGTLVVMGFLRLCPVSVLAAMPGCGSAHFHLWGKWAKAARVSGGFSQPPVNPHSSHMKS